MTGGVHVVRGRRHQQAQSAVKGVRSALDSAAHSYLQNFVSHSLTLYTLYFSGLIKSCQVACTRICNHLYFDICFLCQVFACRDYF